jgi:hypothetical protein
MLNTRQSRRPRILFGQGRGLAKCVKCGVSFVAKHPAEQTCSKCTVAHKQSARPHPRVNRIA